MQKQGKRKTERIVLVTFGLGGHQCYFENKGHTLSGYRDPGNFILELIRPTGKYCDMVPQGTPVIDMREILNRRPKLAWLSPLVDVTLQDNEICRCGQFSQWLSEALCHNTKSTTFGHMVDTHQKVIALGLPGPLDYVSVGTFVRWWECAGARIGSVKDGIILWKMNNAGGEHNGA